MPQQLIILLSILGIAGAVALIAFILYRTLHPKMKDVKPSEEQMLEEEMDRMLKPIEDEEAKKAVEEYRENDD